MKNVTNAFKQELNNGNRNFLKSCTITLADGTVLNITQADTWQYGFSIDEAVTNENSFDLGSAIVDEFDLTLNNIYDEFSSYDFDGAIITNVRIGLTLSNGTTEYVKRGVFTVNEAKYNGSIISLECFDNMIKFDREYSESKLTYPTTLLKIVQDACSVCGVTMAADIASFDNSNFTVANKPEVSGVTFRKILAWVAQISGIWFKCNENGQLSAKSLDMALVDKLSNVIDGGTFNPWESKDNLDGGTFNPWSTGDVVDGGNFSNMSKYHHIFSLVSPDIATDDVVVTGIKVIEKTEEENLEYMSGDAGYVLSIEENDLIQGKGAEVANYLGNKFIGLRFRPLSVNCMTDPTIEAGDVAFVTDRHNRSYLTIITQNTLTPGKYQAISCRAETAQRNSASRFSSETKMYQELRKSVQNAKTEFQKAVEDLATKLGQTEGAYTTIETLANGSKIFYLHNKPTVAESQMIWKMTAEAWGVSTDGGNTWNAGMTVDGVVIAKILNTIGVNADWINTGALTVKDASGNVIFEVDMDTNKVFINAQHVTIGSKNVSQAITDVDTKAGNAQTTATNAKNTADTAKSTADNALTTAQNAQALSIVMTNEYQGVPTDANGNYSTFPTVSTAIKTYFGHSDVSSACTYSVSKSSGVTGSWNSNTRVYTVTALTVDTGYVDITASYLNAFTVTKRFTIAKVKAGATGAQGPQGNKGDTGAAGRTYFLQASTLVMKIGADKVISPRNVTFSSYYRDGTSATRTAYAGRFVIQETLDGSIWTTKYTSSSDETSRVHTPSSANVVAIKCTMYAAGGTSIALDMQTVSLLLDVDNLSQEQIFNILTNNGQVQGVYLEQGKIYINASYIKSGTISADLIKGGTVRLGGSSGNGYSSLEILDDSDVKKVELSNGKLKFYYDDYANFMYLSGEGLKFYKSLGMVNVFIENGIFTDFENSQVNANFYNLVASEASFVDTTTRSCTINSLAYITSDLTATFDANGKLYKKSSSSERYKDIERVLTEEDIENLYSIDVYSGKYKDGYLVDSDERNGEYMPMFVVENIEKYLPIAVSHNPDGSPEMWSSQIMIPVMFQMLKSQKATIDTLTDRLNKLENLLSMKGVI